MVKQVSGLLSQKITQKIRDCRLGVILTAWCGVSAVNLVMVGLR